MLFRSMGYDPTGNWDWGGVLVGLSLVAAGVITIGSFGSGAPIGVILVAAAVTATGAVITCAAATDSVMVVDVSGAASAIQGKKAGASVVVDFKNDNANLYTHKGKVTCNSVGLSASYSVGLVDNYTKPEDYAGPFADVNGGPLIGLDHCWNPEVDYGVATKATAITFNAGRTLQCPKTIGLGTGYDKYSDPTQLLSW